MALNQIRLFGLFAMTLVTPMVGVGTYRWYLPLAEGSQPTQIELDAFWGGVFQDEYVHDLCHYLNDNPMYQKAVEGHWVLRLYGVGYTKPYWYNTHSGQTRPMWEPLYQILSKEELREFAEETKRSQ